MIQSVEGAEGVLTRSLPASFGKLRAALRPMVGGDLSRVVFVSYGHPALRADGSPCTGGQAGFDVHPAFKLDGERLRQVSNFTERALPAAAQGDRAVRERSDLRQSGGRSHDLRRRASAGVRRPWGLRALRTGPGVRSRVLFRRRQELRGEPGRGRDRAAHLRASGRANSAPTRRARAGCAPRTTATSSR